MRTDIEQALDNKTIPWTNIEYRCNEFWIFNDTHLVFAPTTHNHECLMACFKGAYQWGVIGIQNETCTGFTTNLQIGESAGQMIQYPHVCLNYT